MLRKPFQVIGDSEESHLCLEANSMKREAVQKGSAASSRPGAHLVSKGLALQATATHPTSSHAGNNHWARPLGREERGALRMQI